MWSDEINFVADPVANRRNRRIIAKKSNVEKQTVYETKYPASVMVFGPVESDGKVMPPIFIEAGLRVTGIVYCEDVAGPVIT